MLFQKAPRLKPFSKTSVKISVFGHFSVTLDENTSKSMRFSYENALVWPGTNPVPPVFFAFMTQVATVQMGKNSMSQKIP